jgi:DNA invertase Pin-like site-specific DNA recombinase
VFSINKRPTKRASNPKTRHTLDFALPLPASTITNQQVSDKAKVRETIFQLRAEGLSYREIAKVIGLHFTRVRQIIKANKR